MQGLFLFLGIFRAGFQMVRGVIADFQGRDCPHLKFRLYQTVLSSVVRRTGTGGMMPMVRFRNGWSVGDGTNREPLTQVRAPLPRACSVTFLSAEIMRNFMIHNCSPTILIAGRFISSAVSGASLCPQRHGLALSPRKMERGCWSSSTKNTTGIGSLVRHLKIGRYQATFP